MSKISVKFFITILLSLILANSHSIAFHKENQLQTSKKTEWDGSKDTKKDFQNKANQEFCSLSAKGTPSIEKGAGEPVIDQTTGEQTINEDTGEPLFEDKKVFKIKLSGYHSSKSRKTGKVLIPSPAKGLNFNINADWTDIKLISVLKMYCLQDSQKDRPVKFKDSYLEDFYKKVAADNGYFKSDGVTGDYTKKLMEGPEDRGPLEGRDILKDGIIISNSNAVWYLPDFLMIKEAKIVAELKKNRNEEKKRKKKQAKNDAIKKGKAKWISENKQYYIDQFIIKNDEYQKIIQTLEDNRKRLNERVKSYEELTKESMEEIEIAFDDLANIDQEIKDKKREIRKNKKEYLSKVILESFEDRLKKINSINFKKYDNHLRLKKIIKKAKKSNSPLDFLGNEGFRIPLPKFAGGGSYEITSDKLGFIDEFENLKNKSIGSGSRTHSSNMIELDEEIAKNKDDINYFIIKLVKELVVHDNALEEQKTKIPWRTYLLIFLIIITSIIALIFYLKKTKKDLKEEAEQKVGTLKNELENKLRNTSDQIKSASKDTIRSQQSSIEPKQTQISEVIPKTPEQIIKEKYDELVSDYSDALEDFSKVAEFKQKWQGLALTRKERQDGTKTILINSPRAFEKAEIWCVTFDEKYFAFPGSSVKFNMATYMNLDFEKAGRDFKGVFLVSSGSNYSTEPAVLRRGGVGFIVDTTGSIVFPS